MQQDAVPVVFGDGEADGITRSFHGDSRALPGVAKIAKLAQLMFGRSNLLAIGHAHPAVSCAQRQPAGKWPVDVCALLGGEKIRASHNMAPYSRGSVRLKSPIAYANSSLRDERMPKGPRIASESLYADTGSGSVSWKLTHPHLIADSHPCGKFFS